MIDPFDMSSTINGPCAQSLQSWLVFSPYRATTGKGRDRRIMENTSVKLYSKHYET